MELSIYRGDGSGRRHETPAELPVPQRSQLVKPESYIADSALRDACNVALLLGQPLLLTGEPGTGKSQFAYSLSWELGFASPFKFETKSDSIARDLFYTYDALRQFQDVQSGLKSGNALDYITYRALGIAILRTKEPEEVRHLMPPDSLHSEKQRSVVLIDEVDKAPRDFPNDLLNELDQLYFRVPELGNVKVEADPALQPVIIVTSNSEKDLPDAFLRRCIYYNIPFPGPDRLAEIVACHLGLHTDGSDGFLQAALNLFHRLRSPSVGLRKKPSTAELLGWLISLRGFAGEVGNPMTNLDVVTRTLGSLVKTAEDQPKAQAMVKRWFEERSTNPAE
ncbi:MoxR-like ATPase [Rubidibacter lacunae KORDI 51-2]|uniref:MoxR-like ATPase n=1 Tax=Rubidibacter lacunae KORDI 51-2 TaxID=582515 RepID=U5DL77_9CHRO|nr:MoxR family ATPase [Rubidibacter lacunae]ERN41329.1 MoxR-like ATPase [Rubidibacter lacunae KORDI 51-2]